MTYVLDTNILLYYLRGQTASTQIDSLFNPFGAMNDAVISVVSMGEIKSIAKMNGWSDRRADKIDELFEILLIADINNRKLIECYAEIDAFSQGKLHLPNQPIFSSRNMGKNDIWIAATTSLLDATLLTTDNDFNHLHQQYLHVEVINPQILSKNI